MIYGVNFGAEPIPTGVRRKFASRCRYPGHNPHSLWYHLVGVATSADERDMMLTTATNGTRKLYVVTRHTAAGDWFGIYAA